MLKGKPSKDVSFKWIFVHFVFVSFDKEWSCSSLSWSIVFWMEKYKKKKHFEHTIVRSVRQGDLRIFMWLGLIDNIRKRHTYNYWYDKYVWRIILRYNAYLAHFLFNCRRLCIELKNEHVVLKVLTNNKNKNCSGKIGKPFKVAHYFIGVCYVFVGLSFFIIWKLNYSVKDLYIRLKSKTCVLLSNRTFLEMRH